MQFPWGFEIHRGKVPWSGKLDRSVEKYFVVNLNIPNEWSRQRDQMVKLKVAQFKKRCTINSKSTSCFKSNFQNCAKFVFFAKNSGPVLISNETNKCDWSSMLQNKLHRCTKQNQMSDPYNNDLSYTLLQEVCSMVTAPEVFGAGAAAVGQNRDPCPRYRKYVEVAYKCKPTQVWTFVHKRGKNIPMVGVIKRFLGEI